jgi:hypothetical protein
MSKAFHRLAALGVSATITGGLIAVALAQGAQPPSTTGAPAPQYGAAEGGPPVEIAEPSETAPSTERPVLYVTGVEVLQTTLEPKLDIVRVTGLTASADWSGPQLVPTFAGKPSDDILDLQFIATVPEESQKAEGFVPISATLELQSGHPFKGVRVHAAENAIQLKQIPGSSQATINVNGCADCIGKKFIEKGQAQQGQQGIVREEDLPKELRWIIPSGGILDSTQNPNRLNLILSDDNTIVAAYWE